MKTKLIIMLLFFNSIISQNNEIENLNRIKKELINKKETIQDSINKIDIKINFLLNKNNDTTVNLEPLTTVATRTKTQVRNVPSINGNVIGVIDEYKMVTVYDYKEPYWLITRESIKGYVHEGFLFEKNEMKNIKNKISEGKNIDKFGKEIGRKINLGMVWIGMTAEMAKLSWGTPKDINRTTGTYGVHEQWVYQNKYLYLEDGKVTSWQD